MGEQDVVEKRQDLSLGMLVRDVHPSRDFCIDWLWNSVKTVSEKQQMQSLKNNIWDI